MLLLAEAVERLAIRPILVARKSDHNARAAANVEAILERARPYAAKGLKRFARDLAKEWEASAPHGEGQVDAEGDAIQIVTIHSSKGLEWPVVIPINTGTLRRSREQFVHRASDDTLHWVLGDVVPPDLHPALQEDEESVGRERERLWYVACTRARELLILPELPGAAQKSWARIVHLAHRTLPKLDLSRLSCVELAAMAEPANLQTADVFAAERAAINRAVTPITWLRPSDDDLDRIPLAEVVAIEPSEPPETEIPVGPGRMRGLILHKLMEEVLTGELAEYVEALAERARALIVELAAGRTGEGAIPSTDEIAETTHRTLNLPEIAVLRPVLVPELPLYAMLHPPPDQMALAGRADAIAFEDGRASVVLDWKSDIAPTSQDIRTHAGQLQHYMVAAGAGRGALVYMTSGTVRWVEAE